MKRFLMILLVLLPTLVFAQGFNLLEPINGDTVETLGLDFDWQNAPSGSFSGQIFYHLEANLDSSFTLPAMIDEDSLTSSNFSVDVLGLLIGLLDSTTVAQKKYTNQLNASNFITLDFYWRVTAWDTIGTTMLSNTTEHFVFSPGTFDLLAPADSTVYQTNPTTITFSCTKPTGVPTFSVLTYTVMVIGTGGQKTYGPFVGSTFSSTFNTTVNVDSLADGLYGWGMIASATDLSGTTLHASKQFFSFSIGNPIAVSEKTNQPKDFVLEQNHPNPFNPSTTISYEFKNSEKAKLLIFNVLGEKVMDFSLEKPKGSVVWDGKDASGNFVSSGVYFYKLETGNFSETKKMLFLK